MTSPTRRSRRNWRLGMRRWSAFVRGALREASRPHSIARLRRIRPVRGSSTARRRRSSYRSRAAHRPRGVAQWTLSLLGERLIELKVFESVSKSSVQRTLKKNELKPWRVERFCIPPEKNAPFVSAMEDVLDVYHLPYDETRPVVCFDETSKQLVGHARAPLPPRPGTASRVDDEYIREGTANIFAAIEPITGKALVQVTERRTSIDTAHFFKRLSDEAHPAAKTILLVMDNLSTPLDCVPLRSVPAHRGPSPRATLRDPSHPKARKLARCRGDLPLHHVHPVPQPACARCTYPPAARRRVATIEKGRQGQVAVSRGGRADQTPPPLPLPSIDSRY